MAKLEWERAQEKNIEYVAKTRSRDRLVFVVNKEEEGD
jgi:ATP-dependent exoDNAse (exonuclease V) beta subunit